jgi:hypothetical protein
VGYGTPSLGFHYIPVSDKDYNDTKVTAAARALVTIRGGELTAEQVQGELERLVPVTWQWEVKEHGANSFLTAFPNAMELALMEFGDVKVKNCLGISIECTIWGTHEEVKFKLNEVWVQVGGIPQHLPHSFWAVGTLISGAEMVDMAFTRSNDLARIKIVVLDPKKIPETLEVVFGKYLHGIYFIVENGEGSSGPRDGIDTDPMGEDDDLLREEQKELGKDKDQDIGGASSGEKSIDEGPHKQDGKNKHQDNSKQVEGADYMGMGYGHSEPIISTMCADQQGLHLEVKETDQFVGEFGQLQTNINSATQKESFIFFLIII